MRRRYPNVLSFFTGTATNAWCEDHGTWVYLRRGRRLLDRLVKERVLDIATLSSPAPGSGRLGELIDHIELLARERNYQSVYVENVFNERLQAWFTRRGYRKLSNSYVPERPSFYKHLEDTVNATLQSGGAEGSDAYWGEIASKNGYDPLHYSFKGHKFHVPASQVLQLTEEQLDLANPRLLIANKTLKRRFPPSSYYTKRLLQRNWYQIKRTDAVYAVSGIAEDTGVQGGTAWATQMFIDLFPRGRPLPLYLFDQQRGVWLQWAGERWTRIPAPPTPPKLFTGIGTRNINEAGRRAVESVFE